MFTVPVTGGAPTRLTWHPGPDVAQGFTPDGKARAVRVARAPVYTNRYVQLFTVPVQGGVEEPLPIPNAARATYSPDGTRIAYNPLSQAVPAVEAVSRRHRRRRSGSTTSKGHAVEKIPQPASRANDTDPMWVGDIVYFRSDRNGEFNLFAFNTRSKQITQLTRHTDFPVLYASAGNGRIIYEQAGSLHILETQNGRSRKLTIGVASDLLETRPRFVKGARWIRDAGLVADRRTGGVRVPRGDRDGARRKGRRPQSHEQRRRARSRSLVVSRRPVDRVVLGPERRVPALHRQPGRQRGAARHQGDRRGLLRDPVWSPDSQKIAYWDNSQSVYWVDVASGVSKKIASQPTVRART